MVGLPFKQFGIPAELKDDIGVLSTRQGRGHCCVEIDESPPWLLGIKDNENTDKLARETLYVPNQCLKINLWNQRTRRTEKLRAHLAVATRIHLRLYALCTSIEVDGSTY